MKTERMNDRSCNGHQDKRGTGEQEAAARGAAPAGASASRTRSMVCRSAVGGAQHESRSSAPSRSASPSSAPGALISSSACSVASTRWPRASARAEAPRPRPRPAPTAPGCRSARARARSARRPAPRRAPRAPRTAHRSAPRPARRPARPPRPLRPAPPSPPSPAPRRAPSPCRPRRAASRRRLPVATVSQPRTCARLSPTSRDEWPESRKVRSGKYRDAFVHDDLLYFIFI